MQELWQPVKGYEGLYEVSDQGRVRNPRTGLVHRAPAGSRGYREVHLRRKGKGKTFRVHALVLTAFVSIRPEGLECRHLDGNKLNNAVSNLEWGTSKENSNDIRSYGNSLAKKLTEDQARLIKYNHQFQSLKEVAAIYDIHFSLVSLIRRNKVWAHI